jgi:hypothetical protein
MPKIVRFHQVGGPGVLKIEEETPKQPGKGEARLKVQALHETIPGNGQTAGISCPGVRRSQNKRTRERRHTQSWPAA